MLFRLLLLSALTITLFGCATHRAFSEDARLYQLYIDEKGNLLDPDTGEKLSPAQEDQYVTNIVNNFTNSSAATQQGGLTIFIHGGLNTFKTATGRVKQVKNDILASNKYPLFISWNSGPLTNYGDHLLFLRRGIDTRSDDKFSAALGPASAPFVFLEDGLRSIARLPSSTYNVLLGQNSVRISNYSSEEEDSAISMTAICSKRQFQVHDSLNNTGLGFRDWATIWNPTKLITAPFVDGLGTGAWDSMLRRTDLVLRKDASFNGEPHNQDTAVTKFFNHWTEKQKNHSITLIGHSMGTIVANNIISMYQDLDYSRIVYMGSAARMKDLEQVVSPYLERNQHAQFYNLTLSPYREYTEMSHYDFIPRGSLLVWIDQTFGDINSFQDRTAGFWFNMARGAEQIFTPSVRNRVHLTQFGITGKVPKKHGDFGDFPFWKESFWEGETETATKISTDESCKQYTDISSTASQGG